MLEAKSQLFWLIKGALAVEEVIIASYGKGQVKLVRCTSAAGLSRLGRQPERCWLPGNAWCLLPPSGRLPLSTSRHVVCDTATFCDQSLAAGAALPARQRL